MRVWDCLGPRFPPEGGGQGGAGSGVGAEGSEGELKSEPGRKEIYSPAADTWPRGREEQTPQALDLCSAE